MAQSDSMYTRYDASPLCVLYRELTGELFRCCRAMRTDVDRACPNSKPSPRASDDSLKGNVEAYVGIT